MSINRTDDPFGGNNSPFSRKTRNGEVPQPQPVAPTGEGTPANGLPNLPGLPGVKKPTPVSPQTGDLSPVPENNAPTVGGEINVPKLPGLPKPTFKPVNPNRDTADELFPVIPGQYEEPGTEVSVSEDDIAAELEDDETVEDVYEDIYGEDFDPALLEVVLTDDDQLDVEQKMDALSDPVALPTLYALAEEEDWTTRAFVAANLNTPEVLLARLAEDEESMVRQNVMENPNISDALYRSFAFDEDEEVVAGWVQWERTTPEMLTVLHDTKNDLVASVMLDVSGVPASVKATLKTKHGL